MLVIVQVKIWEYQESEFICKHTITSPVPVTAVDFLQVLTSSTLCLAYGTEDGGINVCGSNPKDLAFTKLLALDTRFVNCLVP
jgi:hypothetical protein